MILFNNFKREYRELSVDIDRAVKKVFNKGWFIMGEELVNFEKEFATYNGTLSSVGVANGTDAITLALKSIGITEGDQVITTSVTAYPTITGIVRAGAIPVVVDIKSDSGLIDAEAIGSAINSRTRAILPVHLYGSVCEMDEIMRLSEAAGVAVVEDCAQAVGASYNERKAGTFGQCAAFSFYPTKNLGAYGDAGAVVTNSKDLETRLIGLRNYGESVRYKHDEEGINSRLDEIQAAILRVKLPYLDRWNRLRRRNAEFYKNSLRNVGFIKVPEGSQSCYHLFPIKVESRDSFVKYLELNGIPSLLHYPIPVHRQKAFKGLVAGDTPEADSFTSSICSLPIHPWMEEEELEKVVEVVNGY